MPRKPFISNYKVSSYHINLHSGGKYVKKKKKEKKAFKDNFRVLKETIREHFHAVEKL